MQLTRLAFPNPQITNLKNGQSQKQSLQSHQMPGAKDFVTFGAGPSSGSTDPVGAAEGALAGTLNKATATLKDNPPDSTSAKKAAASIERDVMGLVGAITDQLPKKTVSGKGKGPAESGSAGTSKE